MRTIYTVETVVSRENDLESKDRRAVRDTMVEDAKHSEDIVHRGTSRRQILPEVRIIVRNINDDEVDNEHELVIFR